MKQPHIRLDESLNVRYAILPGDPRRAERIASHMSEVEDLGMNREYRSLVGTYRGARILAMSTGMGGVSTGIAVEELHNIGVTHAMATFTVRNCRYYHARLRKIIGVK